MTYVERLVAIYMRSRSRLLDEISKRKLWGRSTWQQEGMLKLIDDEIARLNKETALWTEDAIKRTYMYGALSVWQAAYEKDKRVKAFGSFGGLHKRAIGILTHNTQDFLRITNSLIARQAQDTVRQIGVEVTSAKFAENLTVRETAKLMEKRLKEEGFYATVPWRNGKGSMRTDSYAELVARTTTAEATNTGTLNQMEEMGYVLFKMTAHNTTCKVCASRQGRVYRTVEENELPENDPRRKFPHISEALPRWPEYRTVHPNCAHRILAFIWDQKSKKEQDAALKDANKPFDVDPRSEAERKRYEEIQRKNRERLRDRKQWEKYRAVLGNKNVPNFSGFRAMKRANSDRWLEMTSDYRYALRVIRKDDILETKYFRSLPMKGEPFSLKDLIREDGTVRQRRLYGKDGKPLKDIDTNDHGNPKTHPFSAHAHDWNDKGHGPPRPLTDKEKQQNKDILGDEK